MTQKKFNHIWGWCTVIIIASVLVFDRFQSVYQIIAGGIAIAAALVLSIAFFKIQKPVAQTAPETKSKEDALTELTKLTRIEVETGNVVYNYFSARNQGKDVKKSELLKNVSGEAKKQSERLIDFVDFLIEARDAAKEQR